MSAVWQVVAGVALAYAGWRLPRRIAATRGLGIAALLDAAPLSFTALVLFVVSGRPLYAGAIVFALGGGFAFADRTVRDTLREPVLFTALSELPQIFTHPHLYLPFAGTGLIVGGAAAAVLTTLALLVAEPAVTSPHPLAGLVVFALMAGLLRQIGREPWLGHAARALRRLRPTGEPFADAARLGPVAILIAHGVIARAERAARQARLAPIIRAAPSAVAPPMILVQCESFFDARRLLPALPRDILAGYDACCRGGGGYGRLDVPAWGANTTRAEFAVLTGIGDAALGYDRFNPYHALARTPIASEVWRLRQAGYRTICLHPFDRRFNRRDLALPALGFDEFFGRETLGGSRAPPYAPDPDLAGHILRVLDRAGPRVFIFAITMGNHGPWIRDEDPQGGFGDAVVESDIPQRAELLRYLAGLRRSDEMLRILIDGLEERRSNAVLGFYGDHLPSLPAAFAHFGFDDWRSDYAIWSLAGGAAIRRDLSALELGRAVAEIALRAAPLAFDIVRERHDA